MPVEFALFDSRPRTSPNSEFLVACCGMVAIWATFAPGVFMPPARTPIIHGWERILPRHFVAWLLLAPQSRGQNTGWNPIPGRHAHHLTHPTRRQSSVAICGMLGRLLRPRHGRGMVGRTGR